ncbi:hypothetical protein M758_4G108200 [Ceratodon purpureus]|nr:hypothetical protein M758_4G108200 [Ceratodon purpureus]
MKKMVLDQPSGSDDLTNPQEEAHSSTLEEEEQRSRELQRSLEASIPKPLPKPLRSECEIEFSATNSSLREPEQPRYEEFEAADSKAPPHPPQYQKYQELLSKQTHPQDSTFGDATEDYTASDYYDKMRAVDKEHHHTTGTGFIKISEPDEHGEGFHHLSHPREVPNAPKAGISNPAMNDWVPQPDPKVPKSTKPLRSESNVDSWN